MSPVGHRVGHKPADTLLVCVSDGDRDATTYDVDAVDGGGSAPVSAATTPVDDHGHDHGHSRSHRRTDSRDGAHTPELDGDDTRAASTTSATDSADVVALQKSLQVGLLVPRGADSSGVALSAVSAGIPSPRRRVYVQAEKLKNQVSTRKCTALAAELAAVQRELKASKAESLKAASLYVLKG